MFEPRCKGLFTRPQVKENPGPGVRAIALIGGGDSVPVIIISEVHRPVHDDEQRISTNQVLVAVNAEDIQESSEGEAEGSMISINRDHRAFADVRDNADP